MWKVREVFFHFPASKIKYLFILPDYESLSKGGIN